MKTIITKELKFSESEVEYIYTALMFYQESTKIRENHEEKEKVFENIIKYIESFREI